VVTNKPDLVVAYKIPLVVSLTAWAFGWLVISKILLDGGFVARDSPGPWFDITFSVLAYCIILLPGPIGVIKYSLTIRVRDDCIYVRRYFWGADKIYKMSDIVSVGIAVDRNKKVAVPRINIAFSNGDGLSVSGYASRFQEFLDLLMKNMPDRLQKPV
jgi:hypothetical protein